MNETVLLLLSENSEILEDLTETVVHAVTQNAVPMTVEEQERSMVTRLRTRMRKDTKKDEFIYERKRKRCTGEAEKLDPKDDPKQVVDVENFPAGQKKELVKPIPIKNIRTNAVHRYLLREEKDKIKRIWDEADTRYLHNLNSYCFLIFNPTYSIILFIRMQINSPPICIQHDHMVGDSYGMLRVS